MKKFVLILLVTFALPLAAQDYELPQVAVSKDKVRVAGKAYYAHVVTAKQTLYSISKVYEVSIQEIYDANKNLNLEGEGLKIGQVLLIPLESAAKENPQPETDGEAGQSVDMSLFPQMQEVEDAAQDTEEEADLRQDVVNVSILLPFNASGKADEKSVDFYSGALLAARDLGGRGIGINLSTYDISGGRISPYMLQDADVIIGPISEKDVYSAVQLCPYGKYVISPLEPKTAGMSDSLRVIQAPTPTLDQAVDAVRWAISDMAPGDSLILIRESGKALSGAPAAMLSELRSSGVHFSTLSYDLLSGMHVQPAFMHRSSSHGVTRYLIASEDESFVNDAIRNINLMAYKKQDVVLYGPSKIRSFATVETENLHNISTHVSSSYQIDYGDTDVRAFVLAYRALFGSEPNSFAFHGYDCLNYFAGVCSRYGRRWYARLPRQRGSGLQTDFSFENGSRRGQINTAVRRLVYTPDYQIVLQK